MTVDPWRVMGARSVAKRLMKARGRSLLLLVLAAGAPGCFAARIDAARGDIAAQPVEHDQKVLPLTVAVARFEDRSGRRLPPGEIDAWTKSTISVLRASRAVLDVFPLKGAPHPADIEIHGAILEGDLHRNYAWLVTWGAFAVGTFGYGTFVAPLLGIPWASDSAALALELRVATPSGVPLGTYRGALHDTLYLTIYAGDDNTTGYCQDPRRALQEVVGSAVKKVVDDGPRIRSRLAAAEMRAGARAALPRARRTEAVAGDRARTGSGTSIDVTVAAPPPSPQPPPRTATAEAPKDAVVGTIRRIDRDWNVVIVKLEPGASVRTDDILEVMRGSTRVGRIRVVTVIDDDGVFSANPDRGAPIRPFRPGDRASYPRD